MNSFFRRVVRFLSDESGPTAVEYAMLLMLIFLACLSAIILIGQFTAGSFQNSSNSISNVTAS